PKTFSNSSENLFSEAVTFEGCWLSVVNMRSAIWGLCRINSTAATMSDKLLLMSWRKCESLRLSSVKSSTVKVTGALGNAIVKNGSKKQPNASGFERLTLFQV